jgi:hypothetical protein
VIRHSIDEEDFQPSFAALPVFLPNPYQSKSITGSPFGWIAVPVSVQDLRCNLSLLTSTTFEFQNKMIWLIAAEIRSHPASAYNSLVFPQEIEPGSVFFSERKGSLSMQAASELPE